MCLLKSYVVVFLFLFLTNNALALKMNIKGDKKLVNFAYNFCSYNTFCRIGNRSVSEGLHSCCAECSCSDDCYLANQCCPDAEVENQDNGMRCRYQYEYFDFHRNLITRPTYTTYYIIDTCQDRKDGDTVDGCLHPTALEDHVLVSDKNSALIYKNGKCALCNGVENYETWDLVALCRYDDSLFSLERRNEYVLDICNLVSKPPKNTQHLYEGMVCSPETIDRCNVTGWWDFYDADIDRGCQQFNMIFTEEKLLGNNIVRGNRTYKNVYCYLCNNRKGTSPSPQCFQRSATRKDNLFQLAPFFSIMKISKSKPNENPKCKIDEIEDPFTGACTQLFCPFGKTAVRGACADNMQETFVSLLALYTVEISFSDNKEIDSASESHTNVFNALTEDIQDKFNRASCDMCDMKLFSQNIFLIRARPNIQCPLSKILKVFRYISSKPVKTRDIYNGSIQLRQTNKYSMDHKVGIGVLEINGLDKIGFVKNQSCFPGVHLDSKFFCKRIVYSVQVLVASSINKTTLEKLLALSDTYQYKGNETDKYIVCLSDYLQLVHSAASKIENMGSLIFILNVFLMLFFPYRISI